jgi:hypothetical protein
VSTHSARTGSTPVKDFSSVEEMMAHYKAVQARLFPGPKQTVTIPEIEPEPEPEPEPVKEAVRPPTVEELLLHFRQVHLLEPVEDEAALALNAKREARRLVKTVAQLHNTTVSDIMGPSRFADHVKARHQAVAVVAERFPHWSLPQLGRFFGRDHTTILHALRKMGVRR